MARVREFDPEEVLDKAMRLFWHKGYAETSMRDLVSYTGVAHAGLYSVFGGKRALFQAVLKHYDNTVCGMLFNGLELPGSGRPEIERFFETILEAVKSNQFQDGCLMCNTAIEFGDESGDIQACVSANIERMTNAFRGALERAKQRKEVAAELDPRATAEFLVTTFHGIAVLARIKSSADRIERSVRFALKKLD